MSAASRTESRSSVGFDVSKGEKSDHTCGRSRGCATDVEPTKTAVTAIKSIPAHHIGGDRRPGGDLRVVRLRSQAAGGGFFRAV